MIIEFHVSTDKLADVVRQRIRAAWKGHAGAITWQGQPSYISRLDIDTVSLQLSQEPRTIALNTLDGEGNVVPAPASP